MRSRRRPVLLLILGIISFFALAFFIYFFSPSTDIGFSRLLPSNLPVSPYVIINVPPVLIFFLLLAIFLFSLGDYFLKSKKYGILIASFVIIYLTFRLFGLTNPYFLILLLALFVTLGFLLSNRKE